MKDTHIPAMGFEEMMSTLHALVLQRKVTGFTNFKSIIYLSMLWVKFKDDLRSVDPPYWSMKVLARLGKFLRYRL